MSLDQTQNFVRATIASAVDSADSTIDVTDSNQLPDPADGEYNLILWDVSTFPRPGQDPAVEVVRATALDDSTDTLSVDRGQENTAAADHPETAVLQLSPTAKMFADIDAKTSALSEDGQTFAGESVVTEQATIDGQQVEDNRELVGFVADDDRNTNLGTVTIGDAGLLNSENNKEYLLLEVFYRDQADSNTDLKLTIDGVASGSYDYQLVDQAGSFDSIVSGADEFVLFSPTATNSGDTHFGTFKIFGDGNRRPSPSKSSYTPAVRPEGKVLEWGHASSDVAENADWNFTADTDASLWAALFSVNRRDQI